MTNNTIATELAAWQDRLAVVSRNLTEINELPALMRIKAHLRDAPNRYAGETASRIHTALAALDGLWKDYLLLNALLNEAHALRKQTGLFNSYDAEIERLLHGRSIRLAATHVPLADRSLLTPAEHAEEATPDELLAAMDAIFNFTKDTILTLDEVEAVLPPKISLLSAGARTLIARAQALGESSSDEIRAIAAGAEALQAELAADPLGAGQKLEDASRLLQEWRTRLDGIEQDRDSLRAAFIASREALRDLQELSRRAWAAYNDSTAKIMAPSGLQRPANTAVIAQLGTWLDQLDGVMKSGDWRAAKAGLNKWTASCNSHRAQERLICAANQAPIDARDELRGRLKGLRAKAEAYAARGLVTDAAVAQLAEAAKDVLYAQPADLQKAASLLSSYEAAINQAIRKG